LLLVLVLGLLVLCQTNKTAGRWLCEPRRSLLPVSPGLSWPAPCLSARSWPAAAATPHFPGPSTTLPRPRSAILGPPGYRRACGMANGSLTRRLGQHPPCRVLADAALYPLCYELNPLARSVASKRSLPTRQITERRAELVRISRPRPLRSSVSTIGMRSGG
jgi:hypothetical protein